MASNRRIKISSSSDIQSDTFYQKVVNHNTGSTKVVNQQGPTHWQVKGEVIGNPEDPEKYKSRKQSEGEPEVKEVPIEDESKRNLSKEYDTSQL